MSRPLTTAESTYARDIPRSCACQWRYLRQPARWEMARQNPDCPWHIDPAAAGCRQALKSSTEGDRR